MVEVASGIRDESEIERLQNALKMSQLQSQPLNGLPATSTSQALMDELRKN